MTWWGNLWWYNSGVHVNRLAVGGMLKLSFVLSLSFYASFQLFHLQIHFFWLFMHILMHPCRQMISYKMPATVAIAFAFVHWKIRSQYNTIICLKPSTSGRLQRSSPVCFIISLGIDILCHSELIFFKNFTLLLTVLAVFDIPF